MTCRSQHLVPQQLVVGDPRHGVVRYAGQVRAAVADAGWEEHGEAGAPDAVHLHFTDRLFGSTPQAAAEWFVDLAGRRSVSVTLHDLPQSSDGRHWEAREEAYARVVSAARGVVCNSRYELALLSRLMGDGPLPPVTVIPLPVVAAGEPEPREQVGRPATLEAAVLGFYYPGKGHEDVAEALTQAHHRTRPRPPLPPRLTVLGAASDGHQAELDELVRRSRARGLDVEVTGYLSDAELTRRGRAAAVPVVAHQHVSASGSLNSWIAAGRRPLVRDSRYAQEMALLRPGTMTAYPPDGLADAIRVASGDPSSTWLADDAVLFPQLPDVAAAYVDWWRAAVPW